MNRKEEKRREKKEKMLMVLLTKARVFVLSAGLKPQASADRDFFRCK